jgi:hypothetical protein
MSEEQNEAIELDQEALDDVAGGGFLEPMITRKPITISKTAMPGIASSPGKFGVGAPRR